jgi:hypothetical protein
MMFIIIGFTSCVGGLERWYLVLGGVAVGRGFEPQSDLELSFAKILIEKPVSKVTF